MSYLYIVSVFETLGVTMELSNTVIMCNNDNQFKRLADWLHERGYDVAMRDMVPTKEYANETVKCSISTYKNKRTGWCKTSWYRDNPEYRGFKFIPFSQIVKPIKKVIL